jgi:hypothetical protein
MRLCFLAETVSHREAYGIEAEIGAAEEAQCASAAQALNLTRNSGGLTLQGGSVPLGIFVEAKKGGWLGGRGGFPGFSRARGPNGGWNWGGKRGWPLIFHFGG